MKNILSSFFVVGLLLVVAGFLTPGFSQWSTSPNINNAVSTATGVQQNPVIISDGAGGAIVTWVEENIRIYAQRISASGTVMWTNNGVWVCWETGSRVEPTITNDGAGGAIVAWMDGRNGVDYDIYAQRISASGVAQWTTNGIALCTAAGDQKFPTITTDGTRGAIVAWEDFRSDTSGDIYVQRIYNTGVGWWGTDGEEVCTEIGEQSFPHITSDSAGGAFVIWNDNRTGTNPDIYIQWVNSSGGQEWASNGIGLFTFTGEQHVETITSDGTGGAIVTWIDYRNGTDYDIYAQRIRLSGYVQWPNNGVGICTATGNQDNSTVVSDGAGGVIITWRDLRNGANQDIYAQRVNAGGIVQWTNNGVAVSSVTGDQMSPSITSDGVGGAIVTWQDRRNGTTYDSYSQRINNAGILQWTSNGVSLSTAAGDQISPVITSDGAGGAIVTWVDSRNAQLDNFYDIYAQNIDRNGYLGDARPAITDVRDVINDQGRKVSIAWTRSYVDTWPTQTIVWYDIWRGIRPSAALSTFNIITLDEYIQTEKTNSPIEPIYVKEPLAGINSDTIYWELIGSVNAEWETGYSYHASTMNDSGPQGIPRYYFKVKAKTINATVFWESAVDSGYSVDNLPPTGVMSLVASRLNNMRVELAWNGNHTDADLEHYAVYRSTTSDFPINEASRLSTTNDTLFIDEQATSTVTMYYKVTAVDKNGNEGEPSPEVIVTGVTDVTEENESPKEFLLSQNFPNPFNPLTVIRYQLSVDSWITLKVYTVLGEELETLVNEVQEAGYKSVKFDGNHLPSGIYLCRMTAGNFSATTKIILAK